MGRFDTLINPIAAPPSFAALVSPNAAASFQNAIKRGRNAVGGLLTVGAATITITSKKCSETDAGAGFLSRARLAAEVAACDARVFCCDAMDFSPTTAVAVPVVTGSVTWNGQPYQVGRVSVREYAGSVAGYDLYCYIPLMTVFANTGLAASYKRFTPATFSSAVNDATFTLGDKSYSAVAGHTTAALVPMDADEAPITFGMQQKEHQRAIVSSSTTLNADDVLVAPNGECWHVLQPARTFPAPLLDACSVQLIDTPPGVAYS